MERSRRRRRPAAVAAVLGSVVLAGASACSTVGDTGTGAGGTADDTVVLVTHDSFAVSKKLLAEFEERSGLTVTLRQPGDAGTLVNQLVLTKDAPLGDAVFGIDNAFAGRALDAGVLAPYASPRPTTSSTGCRPTAPTG